jgi:hypothetical protein
MHYFLSHCLLFAFAVQTEAFMPNLVEIKTEIFEDFDNTIEEGVSPGSPTPHHDELDVQDDLEHAEEQQNSHPNHIEEGKN